MTDVADDRTMARQPNDVPLIRVQRPSQCQLLAAESAETVRNGAITGLCSKLPDAFDEQ